MGSDPSSHARPTAGTLAALETDRWAALLPHARSAAVELVASSRQGDTQLSWLASTPVTRLVGGRRRRDACELLAADRQLWDAVVIRVDGLADVPDSLRWVLDTGEAAGEPASTEPAAAGSSPNETRQLAELRRDLGRARDRLKHARQERDTWRQQAETNDRRREAAERDLNDVRHQLDHVSNELVRATADLDRAAEERTRAVERERRRRDAEVTRLQQELSAARRNEQQLRDEVRRARAAGRQQRGSDTTSPTPRPDLAEEQSSFVPGRPTRLPEGVAPDTTEAARLLLHPGRRVMVDGYNVTLQHRSHLDLEQQRSWLVQLLGTLVAQRRVEVLVVFDGRAAGGSRPPSARGVQIRFTDAGITADDELVLAVEGTDGPVAVVTDDRELRTRVQRTGADVVGTRSLLGVVGA